MKLPTLCGFLGGVWAFYDSELLFHGGYALFRVTDKDLSYGAADVGQTSTVQRGWLCRLAVAPLSFSWIFRETTLPVCVGVLLRIILFSGRADQNRPVSLITNHINATRLSAVTTDRQIQRWDFPLSAAT